MRGQGGGGGGGRERAWPVMYVIKSMNHNSLSALQTATRP